MAFRLTASVASPRFQASLRRLGRDGVEALKPQLVVSTCSPPPTMTRTEENLKLYQAQDGEESLRQSWHKPKISRRKAHVIRKQAIREGTYGSFDAKLGGWDPAWDVDFLLKPASPQGRFRMTVPKKTSRQRTREQRAQKIEKNMEGMDERIDEYYAAKQAAKPPDTFENRYKKLMRVKK